MDHHLAHIGNYNLPDASGHFGPYGGSFVAETLMPLILDLEKAYADACRIICASIGQSEVQTGSRKESTTVRPRSSERLKVRPS